MENRRRPPKRNWKTLETLSGEELATPHLLRGPVTDLATPAPPGPKTRTSVPIMTHWLGFRRCPAPPHFWAEMPQGVAGGSRPLCSAQTSCSAGSEHGTSCHPPQSGPRPVPQAGSPSGPSLLALPISRAHPAGIPSSLLTLSREAHSPHRTRVNKAGHFHSPQPKRNLRNAIG